MAYSEITAGGNNENRNFAGELLKTPGLIFSDSSSNTASVTSAH